MTDKKTKTKSKSKPKPLKKLSEQEPEIIMEEVTQEQIINETRNINSNLNSTDVRDSLDKILGKECDEKTIAFLEGLRSEGSIKRFRVVPLGSAVTLEVEKGLVTLMLDKDKKIFDYEVNQ